MKSKTFQKRTSMLRIKLSYVYDICRVIYPLTQLEYPIKVEVVYAYALNAYDKLGEIYFLFNLKSSFDDIENLKLLLHNFLQNEKNLNNSLNKEIVERIKSNAIKLEFSLKDELAIQPSYLVTAKEGYDIDILTINPSKAFPHLVENFPETEYDVIECGKALAFELPTACAFHLMRIFDLVIQKYCIHLQVENIPNIPNETLGVLINKLEDKLETTGEKRLLSTLKDIKDLYRNPIIHPKINMDIDEALTLFSIVISAIKLILKEQEFRT